MCVILAAGASIRFGRNKLLASFRGKPLLQYAIDAACGSSAVACLLVVGDDADAIENGVDMRRCALLENPGWPGGISTSIRCALRHRALDDGCVFLVGDEPFVTLADVDALITAFARRPSSIVALSKRGVWGTPVLFPKHDYAKLRRLRGDVGAKRYAKTQRRRVQLVEATDALAFADVDTPADLTRLSRVSKRP